MSASPDDLVALALASQSGTQDWTPQHWSRLVQQGRSAGLLARLAGMAPSWTRSAEIPAGAAGHFDAALRVSRAQQAEIRREVNFLMQALAGLDGPVVLLKGAAYVMAGLPAARGRVFGDIDIMVPKQVLAAAETALTINGWMSTHLDAYDQRYYRQWMHELPPMQHVHRGTVLDVHHTILPETARWRVDARSLFERAQALPAHPGLYVLAPADMVLHSMAHLFVNDDMGYALRDLSDLDLLLRHFSADAGFWGELLQRARDLGLTRPLYYGLRHTARVLATPVPSHVLADSASFGPASPLAAFMDALWLRALRPQHPGAQPAGTNAALLAIYLRGHWLRMPLPMLVRHLGTKAWMRWHRPMPSDAAKPEA